MKILIIDDDHDINLLTKTALEYNSYEILQAYSGIEGLNLANEYGSEIKVIILDYMMPDIDGFEVLDKLRKNPDTSKIPVIFLTARADKDHNNVNHVKNVDFIYKPFDLDNLVNLVEKKIETVNK